MKVVVAGGTGRLGSKIVTQLRRLGEDVLAASRESGVDSVTGEGLADALAGARVVVDSTNSPSYEADKVRFFTASATNLLAAASAAGVRHYVLVSVVGSERLVDSAHFQGKMAQERLLKESAIAYSIVRATQFFEFIQTIADNNTVDGVVHAPEAFIQPVAADDVAAAVARIAAGEPINATVEIAGPQRFRFEELIRLALAHAGDPREVVADPQGRYFGAVLQESTLIPGSAALIGPARFEDWLRQ